MRFINRQVTTPNKKILTVENVNYNPLTGEISQLTVTEQNDEGDVTIEGTKLNADNLNSIFDNLERNAFCNKFYKELYGLIIDDEYFTIDIIGNNAFTIPYTFDSGVTLYPLDSGNTNFSISISNSSIVITRTNQLNNSDSGRIKIEFYNQSDYTFLECTLSIKYTYNPSSTNPLD